MIGSTTGSRYSYELYSPSGILIADLTGRAKSRSFTRTRNDADDISFEIDFNDLHRFCTLTGKHPRALLVPGQTELRVRRYDQYLVGGQVTYVQPDISAQSQKMTVRAAGFLNLFSDRYIPFTDYAAQDVASMCWQAIDTSQSQTNGDFGITLGTLPSIALSNETPNRISVKSFIQRLASSPVKGFDFEFTHNKVFNIYTKIGIQRPEARFEYPGSNIKSFTAPVDATRIANEVTALGSGIGDETAVVDVMDLVSQVTYKLRQNIITVNGEDSINDGLTTVANTQLAAWGNPLEVPQIVVDGSKLPYVGTYDIGDYVWVTLGGYKWFEGVNGLRRIEKYTVDISDDDVETVTLYFGGSA